MSNDIFSWLLISLETVETKKDISHIVTLIVKHCSDELEQDGQLSDKAAIVLMGLISLFFYAYAAEPNTEDPYIIAARMRDEIEQMKGRSIDNDK